eukprot:gene1669-2247_t
MAANESALKSLKTILLAGLVAGTLDILAAIAILGKMNAERVLQYIASGIYGKDAFDGGQPMAMWGLFFHYLIAFSFAADYFMLYKLIPLLKKHKVAAGLLFGIFIWVIMNLVILPFTNVARGPFTLNGVLLNMSILMLAVGLPISLIVHRHYAALE